MWGLIAGIAGKVVGGCSHSDCDIYISSISKEEQAKRNHREFMGYVFALVLSIIGLIVGLIFYFFT